MSSYGSSYVSRYGSATARSSTSPASTSSLDRSRTPSTYGSLPRTYGAARTGNDSRSPSGDAASRGASYGSDAGARGSSYGSSNSGYASSTVGRFTPRGYSTDRASDRPKSPERMKYTQLETAALRMGSSSRFGGQIARSPISDKAPNVFGVSPVSEVSPTPFGSEHAPSEPIQVSLSTRSTSPTPPCNSSFLRARRADMDRVDIETVSRPHYRPVCVSSETQTGEGKKPTWGSRLGSSGGSSSSTSTSTSAASRGYRGYIRPGDLPVTKKEEPPPPPERKDVVSRVGGLSLSRPTDLPLAKAPSFIRSGDARSPSYKTPSSTSMSETSVKTAESRSPRRTPEQENKTGFRVPTSTNAESKTGENRNFLTTKPPDPPTRSASKIDLKPPVPKNESNSTKPLDPTKAPSKSELLKSPSKSSIKTSKSNAAVASNALKKSTTTTSVLPPLPNKDFRKSVLNMDLSKKGSSSSSSSSEETTSSSEDSSDDDEPKSNDSRYLTASRTTAPMSSADEVSSISLDRPPKPQVKKDEPKSVVVKTATTATPMKVSFSATDEPKKSFQLRRFDSGQTDWWASSGSDKKNSEKPENGKKDTLKVPGASNSEKTESSSEKNMYKLRKFDSGQAEWWKSSKDVPSLSQDSDINQNVKDESSSSYQKVPLPKVPSSASISKSGVSLHNIPNSVNLEKSENQIVNLNKTPSSSSLQKTPSSVSLPKVPSDGSMQKTGSVSSLPFDEKSPSPSKPGLARTRSSASLQKTGSGAGLQKTGSSVSLQTSGSGGSLQKTPSGASLPKTSSNGSIHKSLSNVSLPKSPSNLSIQKSGGNASLQKTGSIADLSKAESGVGLQKASSNANLLKSPSSANLAAKPPLALSKTDAHEVLEAKEHTPAFLRLHKKYGQAAAESWNRRRLVRVESGERDWWLSDEEKAEEKKARPSEVLGKVYCGLYTNIDHVLGSQAPPPAAFRTPDHSSDDDSSDEEFWREVKPNEVKAHEPVVQPEGMIKASSAKKTTER